MNGRLFIVTGTSGRLGEEFVRVLEGDGTRVVSLSRNQKDIDSYRYGVDLLNERAVQSVVREIDVSDVTEIILIHTVGKFKFQDGTNIVDADDDGIDDEVYSTNVLTLKNLLKPLLEITKETKDVKVCVFASVSDKHNIPFWSSYTRAKNILRTYLHALCDAGKIKALVVNVSTVDTGNENLLRPYADKTYWLKPEEVVSATLSKLEELTSYAEIDVFKEKPNFNKEYYLDHDALLGKWQKEMGK